MNLLLTRIEYLQSGIFGKLESDDKSLSLFTLEHAYAITPETAAPGSHFAPKMPVGTFICQRGPHKLEGMNHPFDTFEITGIEGHSNILFHSGNWNKDSSGCILLGLERGQDEILHSRDAFELFMKRFAGVDSFSLTVL